MTNPFQLKHYNDTKRPALKFVVNFKEAGKRVRKFFSSKIEAQTFVQQKNIAFQNQLRFLTKMGYTLVEAGRMFANARLPASNARICWSPSWNLPRFSLNNI